MRTSDLEPNDDVDPPAAGSGWVSDRALAELLASTRAPTSVPASLSPPAVPVRRVVVRTSDGEEIEVGRADSRPAALRLARELIASIESAVAEGAWPRLHDRYVRPGAIVSVDVQRAPSRRSRYY